MTVVVDVEPTVDDYVSGAALTWRLAMWRSVALFLAATVVAVVVLPRWWAVGVVGLLLVFQGLQWAEWWLRTRRTFRNVVVAHEPFRLTLDLDGVEVITERSRLDLDWNDFQAWRSSRSTYGLFLGGSAVLYLPRRTLTPDDDDEVTALLASKLGPPRWR